MFEGRGFKVKKSSTYPVYYRMGNLRAEVAPTWMDNAVIRGRTSFVRVFIFR